jgi:hypothetical protein
MTPMATASSAGTPPERRSTSQVRRSGTTTSTGANSCIRYYTHGKSVIASRSKDGVTWLSADHQGTAQVGIDAESQQATVRRQTPYGAPRGPATDWPNDKGFVGGTVDNTGLTHLGARECDPLARRFTAFSRPQRSHIRL